MTPFNSPCTAHPYNGDREFECDNQYVITFQRGLSLSCHT